jgi:hypothetical protein
MTARRSCLDAVRFACAALLLAGQAVAARQEPPPQPADAILAKAESPAWAGVHGLEAAGTLAAGGREMTFRLWLARGDRFRVELAHRGNGQVFVVDGTQGWIRVGDEAALELTPQQVWERLSWADVFLRFPDFYRRYPRRDLEPASTLGGRTVRPVRAWPRSGYPYLFLVEEASGRVAGAVRQFYDAEEDAVREARIYYGDFREIEPGLSVAFTVESDEGTYYQTLALDEVRLLEQAPAGDLFAKP